MSITGSAGDTSGMGDGQTSAGGAASPFEQYDDGDVRDLIAEYPLAWVTADTGPEASLLPLLGEYDANGRLVALLGHMGRRNPLHRRLIADDRARVLVNGPSGYVSPDHAERRDWGPTWNYAQLVAQVRVRFVPEENDAALAALVAAMEGDRWDAGELGPRYAGMAQAIVAFRAEVTSLDGRFKLGQDEQRPVFEAIVRRHPDAALVAWMRRFAR